MKLNKIFGLMALLILALVMNASAYAADAATKGKAKAVYTEEEFIKTFSGKSRKAISDKLGMPVKREQSVKPSNAGVMTNMIGQQEDNSKPVNVEMWYYSNVVQYAPKKVYKKTEITFVNDRCMNIAFFNDK